MTEELNLSDFFQIKSQSVNFVYKIDQMIQSVFSTNFDFEKELSKYFNPDLKELFLKLCRDQEVDTHNPTYLKEFLQKIKNQATSAKEINLIVAHELDGEAMKNIVNWFVLNTKKMVVLDVKIDQSLIGGAAINFNGKHFDFSIRNKVEQILLNDLFEPAAKRLEEQKVNQ